jgi:hypothetical protein
LGAAPPTGQLERTSIGLDADDVAEGARSRDVPSGATPEIQDPQATLPGPMPGEQIGEHQTPTPEPPVVELLGVHDPVFLSAHGCPGT